MSLASAARFFTAQECALEKNTKEFVLIVLNKENNFTEAQLMLVIIIKIFAAKALFFLYSHNNFALIFINYALLPAISRSFES